MGKLLHIWLSFLYRIPIHFRERKHIENDHLHLNSDEDTDYQKMETLCQSLLITRRFSYSFAELKIAINMYTYL